MSASIVLALFSNGALASRAALQADVNRALSGIVVYRLESEPKAEHWM
jgi:hypothetical protein